MTTFLPSLTAREHSSTASQPVQVDSGEWNAVQARGASMNSATELRERGEGTQDGSECRTNCGNLLIRQIDLWRCRCGATMERYEVYIQVYGEENLWNVGDYVEVVEWPRREGRQRMVSLFVKATIIQEYVADTVPAGQAAERLEEMKRGVLEQVVRARGHQ